MSVQENIKLDEQHMAAWDAHDAGRVIALMADNVVWRDVSAPQPLPDKAAVRQYVQGWFTAFPDMKVAVKNRVVTEDKIAVELEWTGINTGPLQMGPGMPPLPATGKKVLGKGAYFARVRNGKIVEFSAHPDMAGTMMQLGLVPPPGK